MKNNIFIAIGALLLIAMVIPMGAFAGTPMSVSFENPPYTAGLSAIGIDGWCSWYGTTDVSVSSVNPISGAQSAIIGNGTMISKAISLYDKTTISYLTRVNSDSLSMVYLLDSFPNGSGLAWFSLSAREGVVYNVAGSSGTGDDNIYAYTGPPVAAGNIYRTNIEINFSTSTLNISMFNLADPSVIWTHSSIIASDVIPTNLYSIGFANWDTEPVTYDNINISESVGFTKTGYIASGRHDTTGINIMADTGTVTQTINTHYKVYGVSFAPNGDLYYTGSYSPNIYKATYLGNGLWGAETFYASIPSAPNNPPYPANYWGAYNLAAKSDGTVFVGTYASDEVYKITHDLTVIKILGDGLSGQLGWWDMELSPEGVSGDFWANRQAMGVKNYYADGSDDGFNYIPSFFDYFDYVRGIAFANGKLYTRASSYDTLYEYDPGDDTSGVPFVKLVDKDSIVINTIPNVLDIIQSAAYGPDANGDGYGDFYVKHFRLEGWEQTDMDIQVYSGAPGLTPTTRYIKTIQRSDMNLQSIDSFPKGNQSGPPIFATGITPASGLNNGLADITNLAGKGFEQGAVVKLAKAGQPDIMATAVIVVSSSKITCKFDLNGKVTGKWNVVVTNPNDQFGQLTDEFTINENMIQGNVELQNYFGEKIGILGSAIVTKGTATPEFHNIVLDANGRYSFVTSFRGNCRVLLKCSHWLAKSKQVTVDTLGNAIVNFNLINGDINDDNEVDFSDINGVRAAYGSFPGDVIWNAMADVDGSGEVDFTDINIVRSNYGEIGE